jgi:superfamily I DNA/RNA helicase
LEEGVDGERILLLSFTRVAAADLRDKIAALDAPGVERVRATTLHGYCFSLLQRESVLAITGRIPRILLAHEVDLMLRDVGGDLGNIHQRRRRLEAFVAGWARGEEDYPGVAGNEEDRDFGNAVILWLRTHKAMLIGEVVPEAYRYLSTNPAAEELRAFDHIIVDEYQDLNALEQELLEVLAVNASLCVAGDDDQSIYSVRYANPEGILRYLDREDVESHSIQVCGRCPTQVLAMANSLIKQAPGRNKVELESVGGALPGVAAIVQWPDVETEMEGIVAAVAGDIGTGKREPGQVLILTNWRRIGERIRSRLNEVDIPARSFFTEEELGADPAREALALLRLVVDEKDSPSVRVLIGLGDGTGRTAAYQRVLSKARQESQSPAEILTRLAEGENLGLTVPAIVDRFRHAIAKVQQLRKLELADLVDALFPSDAAEVADLRAVALDALVEAGNSMDLLRAIVESVTQDDVPQTPDFVRVMSLHKSKGLTSPSVFVVAAVDGVLPTVRSNDPDAVTAAIEEGRRLFYVAVTRAAEELVISSSATMELADANARGVRYQKGNVRRANGRLIVRTIASPYIAELGPGAPRPQQGQRWLEDR